MIETGRLVAAAGAVGVVTVVCLAWALGWVDFGAWDPEDWSALAAWVTAGVALAAGMVAARQLGEARRLRLEQAQPYVAVYMESSAAEPHFIDLVMKNFGTTAATDVRLKVVPALQRTVQGGAPEDVWLPECIPVLVPGQEWRTWWDFGPERAETDLPQRYEASVSYKDAHHRALPTTPAVLDWGAYLGRRWVSVYTMHDAAKALREMSKTLRKWQESPSGGLAVFTRDGDEKDQQKRERYEAWRRARQADQEARGEEPDE